MIALDPTVVQTVHSATLALCLPAYFLYFLKLEGTTGDLSQIDSMLAALALEIHGELKDRLTPLFQDTKVVIVTDDAYAEKPGNVVESEAFQEALRTFASTHSGHMFQYGRVLSLRESVMYWRQFLAWSVLAMVAWEIVALLSVLILPRHYPLMANEVYLVSFVPLGAIVVPALFSTLLLRIRNDCLAKIRIGLTSLPK